MSSDAEQQAGELIETLVNSARGFFNVYSIYLGDRIGYYRALAESGPATPKDLAARTGTNERYTREWLEQQTVAGVLRAENYEDGTENALFSLPPGHAEVLTDADSLNYLAPMVRLMIGASSQVPRLLEVYRNGGGVPYGDYGTDLIEGQAAMNRAMLLQLLGTEWIPAMEDIHARLQADPAARVADVGCGAGWSSIGIAQTYPNARVDGFDLDTASIEMANANARAAGVSDRVRFEVRDAGDPALAGRYDLVLAVECIHDMSNPVAALKVMRNLAADVGAVMVVDERVGDSFTAEGTDMEWMMYGWSILHCLPAGMAEQPSVGTGTVLRAPTMRKYAEEAGFSRTEVLPIENDFFRFYRLYP